MCTFSCSIRANDLANRWLYIIGVNRSGKSARSLFNCVSVTDDIKIINEQDKSIVILIGPLYLQTEFEDSLNPLHGKYRHGWQREF